MTTEQNKLVVQRFLDMVNTGDTRDIEKYIAADYVEVVDGQRFEGGVELARAHISGVRQTYPDLHVTVSRQIAEGDWVATQVIATGTHVGEWMGMKPTHKQVDITGVNVDKVVDGKIIEHGGAANTFSALLNIGAIRVVAE